LVACQGVPRSPACLLSTAKYETDRISQGNCLARLPPVFPRKSVVSSSTRGRFWAYEAVNPRFSPEKQGLDALNNYLPRLSIEQILKWADAYHDRTGNWPRGGSGPIDDAPGETWKGIEMAFIQGGRGLSNGYSLAQLLADERG